LLKALAEHAAKTLVFRNEGADVQAGYRVTEVKSGRFQALDCGAQYESWHETFILLWTFLRKMTNPTANARALFSALSNMRAE